MRIAYERLIDEQFAVGLGAEGVYSQTLLAGATNRKAKVSVAFDPRPLVWKDNGSCWDPR